MSTSSTNPSRGQSAGAGLGNIVKGAFQTVQGLGDSIRGNAMDFVDSATGTGGRHTETDVGRVQTEQGINRMEAGTNAPPTSSQPTTATSTSSAAPPLPSRNNHQGGTLEANGAVLGDNLSQPR
ncbi:hypothetical protein ONZ51_g4209 [Trametes cubensis]|uniref:Uncharacterized protein n=1 Tax=Trametes cubensis TaxID=1111947 RepID=A0AAD7TWT4_9APHY|nr:hypothetical protein ONZ51_g4209 [Trametes cubensis]